MSQSVESADARLKLVEAILALEGTADVDFLWQALQDRDFRIRQLAAEKLTTLPGLVVLPEPVVRPTSVNPIAGVDYLNGRPNPLAQVLTEKGEFWIELFPDMAPYHVTSFIRMARKGDYDKLKFHRVVPNFVVQGLDPRGDGWGTGNLAFRDEIHRVRYYRGIVGVPNAGPDTGGCQIFITVCAAPHLDGRYTAIGKVISGMNVVDALQVGDRVLSIKIDK
jgi:peptidylprolyl isomerase